MLGSCDKKNNQILRDNYSTLHMGIYLTGNEYEETYAILHLTMQIIFQL